MCIIISVAMSAGFGLSFIVADIKPFKGHIRSRCKRLHGSKLTCVLCVIFL